MDMYVDSVLRYFSQIELGLEHWQTLKVLILLVLFDRVFL